MKRIKRIAPLAAARILALLYTLSSAVIAVPYGLYVLIALGGKTKDAGVPWWNFLVLPLVYGAVSFIFLLVGIAVYNFFAARIGGIAVEVE
jgi:hypothetical protein